MSFILDALRKSEHERRLGSGPDIMRMPQTVPRTRLPMWAAAALGALGAALLAATLYLLLGQRDAAAPGAIAVPPAPSLSDAEATQPAVIEQLPAPGAAAGRTAPGTAATLSLDSQIAAPPALSPAQPPASQPAAAAEPAVEPADSRALAADTRSNEADAVFRGADTRVDTARLPSYAAIRAEGISLSALQMQLHVHSSSPANRFVVINGSRYAQGETLPEGPRVEEIAAEGAILSFRGREFLLTPN